MAQEHSHLCNHTKGVGERRAHHTLCIHGMEAALCPVCAGVAEAPHIHTQGECHEHHHHTHEEHDHCCCHTHQQEDGCGCGCSHDGPVEKAEWIEIGLGAVLFAATFLIPQVGIWQYAWVPALALLGGRVFYHAIRGIGRKGWFLGEHFLMSIAAIGAVAIGDTAEGIAVMLFYRIGEALQQRAVARSKKSISALLDTAPKTARVLRHGEWKEVSPEQLCLGEIVLVRPGEMIPADGIVVKGMSELDTSSLTGESALYGCAEGDAVMGGSINHTAALQIRITSVFEDSTVSKVLQLTQEAHAKKAASEAFITRFARVYTPLVVGAAALLAVVPIVFGAGVEASLHRALTFLVVSCPCALVISVPLAYFAGIGASARRGMYLTSGAVLDDYAKAKTVALDKTGTLTVGEFCISKVLPAASVTREELLQAAAAAEQHSNHPIAQAIAKAAQHPLPQVQQVREIAGKGVSCMWEDRKILCGNAALLQENGITFNETQEDGTTVLVACDGRYFGQIILRDELRPTAQQAMKALKQQGLHPMLLTGDQKDVAERIGAQAGISQVFSQLLPDQKLEKIRAQKDGIIYIGDGINDAPSLAAAEVGIAMGVRGQDAAIEAADAVLLNDSLLPLAQVRQIARRVRRVVYENIGLSLLTKAACMVLALFEVLPIWMAVFADVGVALIAVLNSLRILIVAR